MKQQIMRFHIHPYGQAASAVESLVNQGCLERNSVTSVNLFPHSMKGQHGFLNYWVTFAPDVDAFFVKTYREYATPETRLLIMNEQQPVDKLVTYIMQMRIRSAHRVFVVDYPVCRKNGYVASLVQRLAAALKNKGSFDRILDAYYESRTLHVVSPEFLRLDVPISRIPELQHLEDAHIQNFEVDEDGSYIYWPELDLHLGWVQFQQIMDPQAARKASQKDSQFNVRYGDAVKKVRESHGISVAHIIGLSGKQLNRIEKGKCRLTTNAITALACAHKLEANEYLNRLAKALS